MSITSSLRSLVRKTFDKTNFSIDETVMFNKRVWIDFYDGALSVIALEYGDTFDVTGSVSIAPGYLQVNYKYFGEVKKFVLGKNYIANFAFNDKIDNVLFN